MDREANYKSFELSEASCNLLGQGKNKEALELLVQAVELNPRNKDAWYNKASALENLGRHEESLDNYIQVLRIDSSDLMAKSFAILVQHENNLKNEELNSFLTAVECNEMGVQIQKSYMPGKEDKLEGAIIHYSKAIELDSDFTEAFNNRGTAKKNLGHLEDALQDYEKALTIAPNYAIAWYNKGQGYLDTTREDILSPTEALKCFEKVLELDPKDTDAMRSIADLKEAGVFRDNDGNINITLYKKSKIDPVYVVILKGDRSPTIDERDTALSYFIQGRKLDMPPSNARFMRAYYPDVPTNGIDGKFMNWLGRELVNAYPELKEYITVTEDSFKSENLCMNILGAESKIGYIKVVHIEQE